MSVEIQTQEIKETGGKRIIIGLLLVLVGVIALMGTLDVIDFNVSRVIFSWPFVLLVIGLVILANSTKKIFGGILTLLGAFFLIPRIFPVDYNNAIIFPILIIALGVYILFKHRERSEIRVAAASKGDSRDYIDEVAIFGGGNRVISSDNFKGGDIVAIFGGSEINLSGSRLAEGDNMLEVITIFGGTEIIVPKGWDVKINITPIFGGFSNKMVKEYNSPIDTTRRLIIKGVAIFGGGEVKSY